MQRIRRLGKREPLAEVYRLKVEGLAVSETLSELGSIQLLYADAAHINEQPEVPYGWQFRDEKVFMPSAKGQGINLFGFINRGNRLIFEMTNEPITGEFVVRQIEKLLAIVEKPTVIVLDNAPSNRNRKMRQRIPYWEARGLYVFYLPVYSPHLNIAEILWRRVKIRIAFPGGLYGLGEFEISGQIRTIKCWKQIENQFFKIQSQSNLILFDYLLTCGQREFHPGDTA